MRVLVQHRIHRTIVALLALAGGASSISAQEVVRDPYMACVAAETAKSPGSVMAEARARQKCRKLYPAQTAPAATTLDSKAYVGSTPSGVPSASAAPTPASVASTPTAVASTPTISTPTSSAVPSLPAAAGGNPHGGPPGLNK